MAPRTPPPEWLGGASSYQIGYCDDPQCSALHIQLQNEKGIAYTHMTVALEHEETFIARLRAGFAALREARGSNAQH